MKGMKEEEEVEGEVVSEDETTEEEVVAEAETTEVDETEVVAETGRGSCCRGT